MDQRLIYSILQYLQHLKGKNVVPNGDELEKAIASLSKATGVTRDLNDQLKLVARNGSEMTLESVFEVAAMTAAPPAAAPLSDEEREILSVPQDVREKFRSYLDKLKSTIYFKDVEPNTPAWNKRLAKAREKFLRKYGGTAATAGGGVPAQAAAAAPTAGGDAKKAEELKNAGNERLKQGDYEGAIRLYSDAIALRNDCAVYYSNRAAAYQYLQKHQLALEDAQQCVKLDPTFFKGFMRVGHSLVALGRPQQAIDEGFAPALALQPDDVSAKQALSAARGEVLVTNEMANEMASNPAIGEMAEQIAAGRGGGGAPGGMPGIEDLMNPEMMRMAMEAMR
jgi:tetratricopeptide (TPR) repeat protein